MRPDEKILILWGEYMQINKVISKYNFNTGNVGRIKYIVIHYSGSVGTAKNNAQYFAAGKRNASAHYFVGHDGDIWQSVEDANIAWHCGAKEYKHKECRNANSIGIELCTKTTGSTANADANWYFEDATVAAAIALTKELMEKYNIPADHVIRHYDVTGKTCPAPYVFNTGKHTWEEFQSAITEKKPIEQSKNESPNAFMVKVESPYLNIRKGPGTNYEKTGKYTGTGTFTVVEVQNGRGSNSGWGRLKSGAGWISLDYAKRL